MPSLQRIHELRAKEKGRGRDASRPSQIPWKGWKDILWRVYNKLWEDRLDLVAAGVSFYIVLAIFPAIAAFVSLYGLFADPSNVTTHALQLQSLLPGSTLTLLETEMARIAASRPSGLSATFFFGLAFALWLANNATRSLFEALNVVYEEREKRSFWRVLAISFGFTLSGLIVAMLFINMLLFLSVVFGEIGFQSGGEKLVRLLPAPMVIFAVGVGIGLVYRFGPSRRPARWRWLTYGSALATIVWTLASALFTYYLSNIADYTATYGSLGAAIGMMTWLWISVYVVLVGAELDAQIEHQTGCDTTVGAPRPLGQRGAVMADTVGEGL
jgi:membrane protein